MESTYKRIEFGQDGSVVVNEPAQAPEAIKTEDTPPEDVQAVEQTQEQVAPQKKQYKSRAKERIEQLAREKSEYAATAAQQAEEIAHLRKQIEQGSKQSKEDMKSTLERQVMAYSQQLREYMKQGESDKAVEAQEALIESKVQLANLTADLANQAKAKVPDSAPIRKPPAMPEAAKAWISDYPEFNSDPVFNASAIAVSNQLVNEGWDHESDDFYNEINRRLEGRFPEVFGIEEENGVQLSHTKPPSPEATNGQQDANNQVAQPSTRQAQPSQKRTTQTVSSSSRPASPSVQQPKKGVSVDFTQEEIAQADAWGIPLEKIARRIVHQEQTRRPDGYTEIFIPKK